MATSRRSAPRLADSAVLPGGPRAGVGARRQCDLSDGRTFIHERITEWLEGALYRVEINERSMPIRDAFSTAGVRLLGPMRCQAEIEIG